MQFFYGTYFHDIDSVYFQSATRTFVRTENQTAHMIRVNWQLAGKIIRTTQAQIWTALNQMMFAYSKNGLSAGMLDNNGNLTSFTMNSQLSVGGVRVLNPISHGEIKGAETTTYLNYKFALEAEFPYAFANDVLSYSETLGFTDVDGGPLYIERIPAKGRPILQQITERSWYLATQTGQKSQAGPNPTPGDLIFDPIYLRTGSNGTGRQITYSAPRTIQGTPTEYSVKWTYEFISADPLIGSPNPQPT